MKLSRPSRLALRAFLLSSICWIVGNLIDNVHFVAIKLVFLFAANAAAFAAATSTEVARGEAACTLPTAFDAAAGAAQDEEKDEGWQTDAKQIPPNFILTNERPFPERVLLARDLGSDTELGLDILTRALEQ